MFKFEKLTVWQKSIAFADLVYVATRSFPADERFGLTNQLRRAATSVSSNIAEGSACPDPDFSRFLGYAAGSLYEVVTQAYVAKNQGFLPEDQFVRIHADAEEISRMLSGLRNSLDGVKPPFT
jgi:four helix bundle protein